MRTLQDLKRDKIIKTDFGEDLSWDYLCYVRAHSLNWTVPTKILYGSEDNLPSRHVAERNGMKFVKAFTKTVMGKVVEDEVLYMKDL